MRHGFVTAGCVSLLALGAALGACETKVTDKDIKLITAGDLRQMIEVRDSGRPEHLYLVDPRSDREFAEGHIVGANHDTLDRVVGEKSLKNPPFGRYTHIVVYGNDPGSPPAKGMAKRIMSLGYKKNTRMYAGGMKEWADTYPSLIEKSPATDGVK